MKFIHLSDLHLGKRVNEYSMIEDQKYILEQILRVIDAEAPCAVLIAGDVYDKSVPSAEAVTLFDWFLTLLSERQLPVFVISGNHDSPERMAFGARLLSHSGIHVSPVWDGQVSPISLEDEHGTVNVYLLPFLKPAHVRRYFDGEIETYTDALRAAISQMEVDTSVRNVLLTHQFVTGAERCESEEISVGGSDNVSAEVFGDFDYVALGHIHRPQNCGNERIRYCGTPLKYSFSEAGDDKSVTVAELGPKGVLNVRTVPLKPMRDMTEIRGEYDELMSRAYYEGTTYPSDYLHITLTDEQDIPDAVGRLRTVYPFLMKLDYDNTRTRYAAHIEGDEAVRNKSPLQLFSDFYEVQNNQPMTEEQRDFLGQLMQQIWEEQA